MRSLLATVRPQPGERARLALAVLLAAASTAAAVALLATSGYLISRAAQRPMIITLMVAIVAVRAFGITRAGLRYGERLASHDLALRQLARLRVVFYRRLVPLVPGQLHGRGRGDLLTRFVADVDALGDAYLRVLIPALVALLVIVGASVAAALILGLAGGVMFASLGALAVLCTWASSSVAGTSARRQSGARARMTGQLVEAIDGAAELALAGRSRTHARQLEISDQLLAQLGRRDALAAALATGLQSLLTGVGLLAVLLVAISGVRSRSLSGVLLAALAFLFLGACEAVAPLPTAARRLRSCTAAAARLEEVCAQRPAVADPECVERLSGQGALCLEAVSKRYGPETGLVLDHTDLRVAAAERVALIGPSGAGKTTIAELLVRFLDPDEGRCTLDGVDTRHLAQDELRRAVLLSGQDAHLFNATIRENLLIGRPDASDQSLWTVLEAVELTEFVAGHAQGLATPVGQRGELLSGGQRQRVALARALLADARFLILDEPVAHLDAPLARRVMRRVLAAAGDRGVLVITHATDALDGFDRVVRLAPSAPGNVPGAGYRVPAASITS